MSRLTSEENKNYFGSAEVEIGVNKPLSPKKRGRRKTQKHKTDARNFLPPGFSFVLIWNNKWLTVLLVSLCVPSPLMRMFLRLNHIIFIAIHKKIYYPLMSPASAPAWKAIVRDSVQLAVRYFVSMMLSICRSLWLWLSFVSYKSS